MSPTWPKYLGHLPADLFTRGSRDDAGATAAEPAVGSEGRRSAGEEALIVELRKKTSGSGGGWTTLWGVVHAGTACVASCKLALTSSTLEPGGDIESKLPKAL